MKIQFLIILSIVFTMSCKTNHNSGKVANEEPVLIAKGNLFGSGEEGIEKQNLVISNSEDWKELMQQMNSVNNVSNSFTETEIDFSKHTIIAVFAELKGNGGHKIELDISTTSEHKLVTVNHMAPKGMATSVMTQPYYIVRIPKTDLPVVFKD